MRVVMARIPRGGHFQNFSCKGRYTSHPLLPNTWLINTFSQLGYSHHLSQGYIDCVISLNDHGKFILYLFTFYQAIQWHFPRCMTINFKQASLTSKILREVFQLRGVFWFFG